MINKSGKIKANDSDVLKIFGIFVLMIAICCVAYLFANAQINSIRNGFLNSISNEQMLINKEIAKKISSAVDENEAIDVMTTFESDGSHYWFLLSDNSLLFAKNSQTMKEFDDVGTGISDVAKFFIRSGASNDDILSFLDKINTGNDFSVILLKDKQYGNELITVSFININDVKYAVGYSVKESFLLSSSKLNQSILNIRILTVVLCGSLFILICGISIRYYLLRNKLRNIKKELAIKNKLVQDQGDQLLAKENDIGSNLSEGKDNIYSDAFMYSFLKMIDEKNIDNVGFIAIKINEYYEKFFSCGYSDANMIMFSTANEIKDILEDNDVCGIIFKNILLVVRLKTSEESMQLLTGKIEYKFSDNKIHIKTGTSLSTGDIYSAVCEAINIADGNKVNKGDLLPGVRQ